MKISKIEFENFRNFKDHGKIKCSTDGKLTIIYGENGTGKTTLHQLFQWVFYGDVHFNKTTTDRLYNLSFENDQSFGSTFDVWGRIDFEHNGEQFSLTRTYTYKKELDDSRKIREELTLNKMDEDYNWKRICRPEETIEKLLPSGLSEYFFFDGESMIADLSVKGKESAGKLRTALYMMFDLDIIESAINHIGRKDLKTTALGKLYLSQCEGVNDQELDTLKENIENAENKIASYESKIIRSEDDKKRLKELITEISENIGSKKSKQNYEDQRKRFQKERELLLKISENAQANFGDSVINTVPQLFISKAVSDAKEKIHLKVENTALPTGVTKKLISYLLSPKTTECICGNPLCREERDHIQKYLEMLPPRSFASLYSEFSKQAKMWGKGYERGFLDQYIRTVIENDSQAQACDVAIKNLDEEQKNSPNIESLVIARQRAESDIVDLEDFISKQKTEIRKYEIYLKKKMAEFDQLTDTVASNKIVREKIEILDAVYDYYDKKLKSASKVYSEKLEQNIQDLLNSMLTSRRKVSVNSDFAVRITDSFNDESKSEGQFAVVSFAYIGGILKMLKNEPHLTCKEFPLVLDGPFSKLDPYMRQNVIDTIPQIVPQVILFSKEDLSDFITPEKLGNVWTIQSNEERNVACVEEGALWK